MLLEVLRDGKKLGFDTIGECYRYGITHIGNYCSYRERYDCEEELENEFNLIGGEEFEDNSIDDGIDLFNSLNV
jgi:hypothetical protein